MFKKWIRYEALFYNKGDVMVWLNQAWQDKCLQDTHVIADEYTRRFEFLRDSKILNLETSPD
jgi:hypothetical protein